MSNIPSFPVQLNAVGLARGSVDSAEASPNNVVLHALLGGGASPYFQVETTSDKELIGETNMSVLYSRLVRLLAFIHQGPGVQYAAAFINFVPATITRVMNESNEIDLGKMTVTLEKVNALMYALVPDTGLLLANNAGMVGGAAPVLVPWDVKFVDHNNHLPGLLAAGLGGLIKTPAQIQECLFLARKLYNWIGGLASAIDRAQHDAIVGAHLDGYFMSRIVTPLGGNMVDRVLGTRPIVMYENTKEVLAMGKRMQALEAHEATTWPVPDVRVLVSRGRLTAEHRFIDNPDLQFDSLSSSGNVVVNYFTAVALASVNHHGGHVFFYGGALQHSFPKTFTKGDLSIKKHGNMLGIKIESGSNTRNLLLWNFVSAAFGLVPGLNTLLDGILVANGPYPGGSFHVYANQLPGSPNFTNRYVNPFNSAVAMANVGVTSATIRVQDVQLAATFGKTLFRSREGEKNRDLVNNMIRAFVDDVNGVALSHGSDCENVVACFSGKANLQRKFPKKIPKAEKSAEEPTGEAEI